MAVASDTGTHEQAVVGNRVELQLLTTLKCNLRCSYCSEGVGNVLRSQKHATYSAAQLQAFVDTHLLFRTRRSTSRCMAASRPSIRALPSS
jgi:sulfatase maturation enzyme AslB (radical SAM superfamily)